MSWAGEVRDELQQFTERVSSAVRGQPLSDADLRAVTQLLVALPSDDLVTFLVRRWGRVG